MRETAKVPVKAAPVPIKAAPVPVKAAQLSGTRETSPEPESASFRGSLSVSSTPPGAQVSLNGRVIGVTPLMLANLPAGSRAVQVRLDGYHPWSSAVQVVADQQATLKANLRRSAP